MIQISIAYKPIINHLRVPSRPLGDRKQQGGPPVPVATGRMLEQLTYAQIGKRLCISSKEARAIVKRNRMPRSHANDGRTLVAVDLDALQGKPSGQPETDAFPALQARIEQLQAELAAEQQRSAGHRADCERERERADQMATFQDKLTIQVKNLRMLLQAAQHDAQPVTLRTLRELWRWLRPTG